LLEDEVTYCPEMSFELQQTTWCYIPENRTLCNSWRLKLIYFLHTAGKRIMVTRYIEKDTTSKTTTGKDRNNWKDQEESLRNEESIAESGRIFVRNLSYTVIEDDIEQLFSKFGELCIIFYIHVDKPLNFHYTKKKLSPKTVIGYVNIH
jgi:hypothetical protein